MQKRKVEEQYVALRAVQVLDDIANGVFEDYRLKTGLINMADDVFPFVVEMQDIYGKAEVLLNQNVIPHMSEESILAEEKKVGEVVKAMSDKPQLGKYLHYVIDEIAKECEVGWVKCGDIVFCEHCGKKYVVGWDGSLMDLDSMSEEEVFGLNTRPGECK